MVVAASAERAGAARIDQRRAEYARMAPIRNGVITAFSQRSAKNTMSAAPRPQIMAQRQRATLGQYRVFGGRWRAWDGHFR